MYGSDLVDFQNRLAHSELIHSSVRRVIFAGRRGNLAAQMRSDQMRALFVAVWQSTSADMRLCIPFRKPKPMVAVVRLSGAIGMAGRGSLNADSMAPVLEKAFRKGRPVAVALEINSPRRLARAILFDRRPHSQACG